MLHHDLPIHKTGRQLMALAFEVHRQLPRDLKRGLGDKVQQHRIEHMPPADTFAAGNSYLGLLRQASKSHHDRTRIANALRKRGHAIQADMTKAYPRPLTKGTT